MVEQRLEWVEMGREMVGLRVGGDLARPKDNPKSPLSQIDLDGSSVLISYPAPYRVWREDPPLPVRADRTKTSKPEVISIAVRSRA